MAGCSLSPRGDGYFFFLSAWVARLDDAAYPREGTVTERAFRFPHFMLMQLIPARGRLRMEVKEVQLAILDAAYPREGTVTFTA